MKLFQSTIIKYYVMQFISGFYFVYPIQAIFLLGKGITATELALGASITLISSTLLEIPTGFIADKYSRKLSVSLGLLSQALAYLGMIFVSSFISFIPIALLLGLGNALLSGSLESLIYDELKKHNREDDLLKTTSRGQTVGTISGIFATFLGPILFGIHQPIPFMLTGIFLIIMSGYVLSFDEDQVSSEIKKEIKIINGVVNIIRIKPILIMTLIEMLLLIFVNIYYQVLYQPKVYSLGLPIQYLGVLDSGNLILMLVMLSLLPKYKITNKKSTLTLFTLLVAFIFIIFSSTNNLLTAIFFGVIFDLAWAARGHIVPTITNRYFQSKDRALSISSMSFVSNLGAAVLVPLMMLMFTKSYLFALIPVSIIVILLVVYPKDEDSRILPVGNEQP